MEIPTELDRKHSIKIRVLKLLYDIKCFVLRFSGKDKDWCFYYCFNNFLPCLIVTFVLQNLFGKSITEYLIFRLCPPLGFVGS